MTTKTLTLFSVIDGDATFNVLSVKAPQIDHKNYIKNKKALHFADVAADELILQRVSIPDEDDKLDRKVKGPDMRKTVSEFCKPFS
ncbi:hypothetical protein BGZ90_003072 [Linnemannia elongata]|nr:hypothetical protein BGZ90_003072 [Linnemannia elongata]